MKPVSAIRNFNQIGAVGTSCVQPVYPPTRARAKGKYSKNVFIEFDTPLESLDLTSTIMKRFANVFNYYGARLRELFLPCRCPLDL
jgi:hypothetical protein